MAEMYEWLKLDEEDPISFVMYGSYEEQMKFLKDEQLGKLIRNAMHYVRTGEQKSEEPIIDMMLSVMANDIRNQKRNQRKKSEAGKAGGDASAKAKEAKKAEKSETKKGAKKAGKKQKPEAGEESLNHFEAALSSASSDGNDVQRPSTTANQYVDEDVDVDKDMDVDGDVDGDMDVCDKTSRRLRQGAGEEAAAENPDEQIRYGENQHLTTRGVIVQMKNFAAELTRKYWGRAAYESDVEKVYDKCYMPGTLPDGEWGAVFSTEKADLLRYAFQQAAMQNGCTWSYIEGIYKKFDERRIHTVEEAVEKEYEWQRGEISA